MIRTTAPVLALLLFVPTVASASPLSIYGYNPRGISMGEAQVSAADDASATYYNPALLTRRERVTFGFGFQLVQPSLHVDGRDDDEWIKPESFAQWTIGVLFPLGGKVKNRIVLGIGLSLPQGYIVNVHAVDPGDPYFYMYESSAQKLMILPAVAFRIHEYFSIGAGLQILAALGGTADVTANLFTQEVQRREMAMALETRQAATVGLSFGPIEGFAAGVSYRQQLGLDFTVPANINLDGVGALDLTLKGTALWTPHEFTFGASYLVPGIETLVSFDMTYGMWQLAPTPHLVVHLDTGGELLDGLGFSEALDLCSEGWDEQADGTRRCDSDPNGAGFDWNLVPKIGLERKLNDVVTLRGGYWYWATPVPRQTRRMENTLDNSAHHLSLGAGFTFDDPLAIFDQPVTIDLGGRFSILREREKSVSGNAQYSYGGSLFQFAGAIRYQF